MFRKIVLIIVLVLLTSGVNSFSDDKKSSKKKAAKSETTQTKKAKKEADKGTSTSGNDAESIINKSLKASGGEERLNNVKNTTMVGTISGMGMEIAFTIYKKDKAFRMDQDIMGSKITVAYDGKEGWMLNPMAGTEPQPLPEESLKGIESQADMTGNPLKDFKSQGIVATLEGNETVDGKNSFKIKLYNTKDSTTSHIFIDASSYLPIKVSSTVTQQGQTQTVDVLMKDYKSTNDMMMPHLFEINTGMGIMTMKISKIDLVSAIDDSLFQMPKK